MTCLVEVEHAGAVCGACGEGVPHGGATRVGEAAVAQQHRLRTHVDEPVSRGDGAL